MARSKTTKKTSSSRPKSRSRTTTSGHARETDRNPRKGDNLGLLMRDLVPEAMRGTDRYIDVITWNIKWFNAQDPNRQRLIASILSDLNADIFVLQEIEEGSMDDVARTLRDIGAGFYKTAYGTNGGDQRVTFMWDLDTIKTTLNVEELFLSDPTISGTRKMVFPRRPLHTTLSAHDANGEAFDFHLVGLHLKSQRRDAAGDDGSAQRSEAARHLADWFRNDTTDEDVIMAGDFNATADKPEFKPFRELEDENRARFESFNPKHEASHFFKNGKGTRLDYIVLSASAAAQAVSNHSEVIYWNSITNVRGASLRNALHDIIDPVSDHMPVVTRFYFRGQEGGE